MQAQCATTNIARTGIASASSTYPGYNPALTNDGNRNTVVGGNFSWANAETPPLPATLDIALTAPVPVNQVVLYTSSGWEIRDFNLQYSNGGGWLPLLQIRGNTQVVRTLNFPQVTLSRLRLVGISGPTFQPGYVRVNELEICSAASQTAAIAGQVVLFRGGANPPLSNTTVDIGGGRRLTTDANGYYIFANLAAGTYTVRASRAGLTCGSAAFQQRTYTRTVADGGGALIPTIVCYDRNPIIYSKGWNGDNVRFNPVFGELQRQGYRGSYANIQTSMAYTPPLGTNAQQVRNAIDEARDTTGQPQVILFGHSMGGLVSRAYVESMLYRRDVSEFFTFGSPHQGVPNLVSLACIANQPAVCQMSKPGMVLFNFTHLRRPGVAYHNIGGDAPMFRRVQLCFRFAGRRVCFNAPSLSVPDLRFRNWSGFASGLIITGPDDGLAQTYSATGMPGLTDRFVTREVHSISKVGKRDYFDWDGGALSAEAYDQCVKPVLVLRSRRYCDLFPTWRPLVGFPWLAKTASLAPSLSTDTLEFNQRSRTDRSAWAAAQRTERSIWIDGSPTVFSAQWTSGSGRVVLIDPSGQIFDPEYAASIYDGEALPGEPLVDELIPELVIYQSDASGASYQFPAPRPGRWRMIVDAGADAGSGGTL
ncbi:MAG: discoidin domain-containing protein, partial [Xanthomonadaceae bacterium]|nr:discoidin domain-containing protein [Xanthomonadaceae bacterium]